MASTEALDDDLATPFTVDPGLPGELNDAGHVLLRRLLSPETLAPFVEPVAEAVSASTQSSVPMAERTLYQQAFIQEPNLWQRDARMRPLVFSARLARAAAALLGVDGVRLYHDQALVKEAGAGHTPWHCDQYYWPLDSDRTITAWIPLVDVPAEMGPLRLSRGSHRIDLGRDVAIGAESDKAVTRHRRWRDLPVDEHPMEIGDVSFHLGWTFHGAAANATDIDRLVFTVIYFGDGTRLAEPATDGQRFDQQIWLPDTTSGEPIDTWLNPLVWRSDGAHEGVIDRLPAPTAAIGTFTHR